MGALFPFREAGGPSNRSGKSFVFDTARWVERRSADWLESFSSALSDWSGRSNGAESRRCRVPPHLHHQHHHRLLLLLHHLTPLPTPFSHPRSPSPLRSSPCADCHTLFTTAGDVTHGPGCLLEYRSDNRGILFDARPCALAIRGPAAETCSCPSAMAVDLFALLCALVAASSAMEGK